MLSTQVSHMKPGFTLCLNWIWDVAGTDSETTAVKHPALDDELSLCGESGGRRKLEKGQVFTIYCNNGEKAKEPFQQLFGNGVYSNLWLAHILFPVILPYISVSVSDVHYIIGLTLLTSSWWSTENLDWIRVCLEIYKHQHHMCNNYYYHYLWVTFPPTFVSQILTEWLHIMEEK